MRFSAFAFAPAVWILSGLLFATSACAGLRVEKGGRFPTISSALAAAGEGETITIAPGTYHEHLVLKRPVVLLGEDGRVTIDGDGSGIVITIRAPGVTISGLRVRGSGKRRTPYNLWGDAGIAVRADNVRLEANEIFDNESGILVWLASNVVIMNNHVHDNTREGVLAFGSHRVSVHNNLVERNALGGIGVYKVAPEQKNDIRAAPRPEDFVIPEQVEIVDNLVRDNDFNGIIFSGVNDSRIENNFVRNTKEAPAEISKVIQEVSNSPEDISSIFGKLEGAGILISCDARRNIVRSNDTGRNSGSGIALYGSDDNRILDNRTFGNKNGILVLGSRGNHLSHNIVTGNAHYGIGIPLTFEGTSRYADNPFESGNNRIWLNDLTGNRINAFDGTSAAHSTARKMLSGMQEMSRRLTPARKRMLERLLARKGRSLAEYERAMRTGLKKVKASAQPNRWDDGMRGNHYDDFDETREGFVDRDGDGIGERARRIPGGNATDRHPLADGTLARPEDPFDPVRLNPYPGAPGD